MPRRNNTRAHVPYQPQSNCQAKRRFPSEKAAQIAADTGMLIQPTVELRVYHCEQCGNWHLTSVKANT